MANGNRQSRNRLVLFSPVVPELHGLCRRLDAVLRVQGRFAAALLIPSDGALNIRSCALMVLNTLRAHSPWPRARDAVIPKGRSQLSPLSNLRFYERLPRPKPVGRTHS